MDPFDDLRAKHAAELAALQRKHAIAAALPLPCHMVSNETSAVPWATYKRTALAEACEVMRAFIVVPFERWSDHGTTMLRPDAALSVRDRERYSHRSGPWACMVQTNQGDRFGPDAELVFYGQTDAGLMQVSVKFGTGYIGMCPALGANAVTERDRVGRIIARKFEPNFEARCASDEFISWASGDMGPVKTAAQFSYLFAADQSDAIPGSGQSHALAQLAILADRAKV